jgi:UDP-N-acetylglucosamine--N-acetylmuramyl-(pentapeptide) pyrophosphoryl-undecaprenol N-acetylglucosamine transferase
LTPRTSSAGGSAQALRRQTPVEIVIAGGGTGGHTSPGLAVAALLAARGVGCAWIGSRAGIEAKRAPEAGIPYHAIPTGKVRRAVAWRNVLDLAVNVPAGAVAAFLALGLLRPRVVFATGGYVAVPVMVAAAARGIPIVLHEQTSVPGLASRLGARLACRVAVTFSESARHLPARKVVVTGNPLRPELRGGAPARAAERFALDPAVPLVYVTGGAQGAQRVNRVVGAALAALTEQAQVVHQCGDNQATGDRAWLDARRAALPPALARRYTIVPYVGTELADIYATATLVVSRAGAGTVNECCQLGLPALFIPLPGTRGDEQTANARLVERAGGAVVLPQAELGPERLVAEVRALLADPRRLKEMGERARRLAVPDAAERLVALLIATR